MPVIFKVKLIPHAGAQLGKKIVHSFLINRNIPAEDHPCFDHCMATPLEKDNILKVIKFQDPEFLKLTRYDLWPVVTRPTLQGQFT